MPEKVISLSTRFWRGITFLGSFAQRKYILLDLNEAINKSKSLINQTFPMVCPFNLKLKWVNLGKIDYNSIIDEDKIIIKVNSYKEQDKNICGILHAYVSDAVSPIAKKYLDSNLAKAFNLVFSKLVLSSHNNKKHLAYFLNTTYTPAMIQDKKVANYASKLEYIENRGIMTNIMIPSLEHTFSLIEPAHIQSPDIINETSKYFKFLIESVKSDINKKMSRMDFRDEHIKVSNIFLRPDGEN